MIKKATKPLFEGFEWSIQDLHNMWDVIDEIGKEELGLTYATPRLEVITYEQMIDAYTTIGMPVMYPHWSFGKQAIEIGKSYASGQQGLAYELVVNTDPMVTYIMENNSATMQATVLAHAVVGHGSFFKNNYLFKMWTRPKDIIPFLTHAKEYIEECEKKYGAAEVEFFLDACHSLRDFGVDKYRKREKRSKKEKAERIDKWVDERDAPRSELDDTLPKKVTRDEANHIKRTIEKLRYRDHITLPEENILYFIEKHAAKLTDWQREIVRIVRKVAQYFYPQRQTKTMNEGWASYCHYYIMTRMVELGYITEGAYLEFLSSHTSIIAQQSMDSLYYNGLNPYALGFKMFKDIERMCKNPTAQDKIDCPDIAGSEWLPTMKNIMENYRDESFVLQFLSTKIADDFRLCGIETENNSDHWTMTELHGKEDLKNIRQKLSEQYSMDRYTPNMEVHRFSKTGSSKLTLRHNVINGRKLKVSDAKVTLSYLAYLWGHDVALEIKNEDGTIHDPQEYTASW